MGDVKKNFLWPHYHDDSRNWYVLINSIHNINQKYIQIQLKEKLASSTISDPRQNACKLLEIKRNMINMSH